MNSSKYCAFAAMFAVVVATCPIHAAVVSLTQGSSSGYTMTDGNTYIISKSLTFGNPSPGGSGMAVANNATVVLYVPQGVTLTANGYSGSGHTSGGAGIFVPSTSTLVITGEGTVRATGGNAGNGGNGDSGGTGSVLGSYSNGSGTSGAGGSGGDGGGGAGAGIGGVGGNGGGGGSGGTSVTGRASPNPRNMCINGTSGKAAGNGGSGLSMGSVYVIGKVSVYAKGGSAGQAGRAGSAAKAQYSFQESAISKGVGMFACGGGGGGGGGAGAAPAYGIGGGGAAGGGGGGGGSGAVLGFEDISLGGLSENYQRNCNAHGGGGSGGKSTATGGATGDAAVSVNVTDCYGYNYGTFSGGAGGTGGTAGSTGGAGTLYVSATATINASRQTVSASTHSAAQYKVTFNANGGTFASSANSVTATLGCSLPTVTVPTRTGYTFGGYWTSTSGDGIQYFSASGTGVRTWDKTSSTTLYARWTANTYRVTLDAQGGVGGATSVMATYDSAMPDITVPTRTDYTFDGYWTETNGCGTQYYAASGKGAIVWNIMSPTTLYAKWILVNQLAIQSQYGTASPEPGLHECEPGCTITASVAPPVTTDGIIFNFLGWTGTGSVPESGTTTNVSFTITQNSTLTWNWERLNRITIRSSLDGGCGFGTQWIPDGQIASAMLMPPEGRYDLELVGDTNGVSLSGTTLSIPSNAPKFIDVKMYSWNRLVGAIPWNGSSALNGWKVVEDVTATDGYSLRSTPTETGISSTNSATVYGPGRIVFDWRISANRGDYARVYVDGVQQAQITRKPEWTAAMINIEGIGIHVISWVYDRKSSTTANDNAAYLDNVLWTPTASATSSTPVPVPYAWFDLNYPTILAAHGSDYEVAANATAANGVNKVWECYVADINPSDPEARLIARFAITDGKMTIVPDPNRGDARVYRILGAKSLDAGATWDDVTELENFDAAGYRFFKVSVALPEVKD